ncbi:alanine racemase [Psychromicrobium silvestre]|uniref:Alanine racemase n=1 Tax=Psychromicrobium silvestre TaxID=1645614 RepID=A0A7Y9S6U4_9MICC|nr:alanine racemase [Psychromicrobium silvestre]NYE95210.1 alanine racemase [Psychromicrobium silvestre]
MTPERQVQVDLEAIRHNVRRIAQIVSPAQVMAVVKADGYGHGMIPVAQAALQAGANWLGVARVSQALTLREAGIEAPLLAWLHTPATDFAAAVEQDVDLGVSGWELDHIVAAAREQQRPARVHLKIDTGLGRNGSPAARWDSLVGEALEYQDEGLLRVVGLFSHLAVADEPQREETDAQLQRFREAVALAEDAGVDVEVRHLANTPAIFSRPDTHFDLVRAGVGIYGLSPFAGQTSEELGLRPAMTLKALVAHCKEVPAGQGVSYGLKYYTKEPSTLALVPLGYGDGVPRSGTGAPVRIAGGVYPVVGTIAMDQLVVDLGGRLPEGESVLGAEAVLFGAADDGDPSVDLWAAAAGTINYEIVTRVASSVERVYLNEQPTEDVQ